MSAASNSNDRRTSSKISRSRTRTDSECSKQSHECDELGFYILTDEHTNERLGTTNSLISTNARDIPKTRRRSQLGSVSEVSPASVSRYSPFNLLWQTEQAVEANESRLREYDRVTRLGALSVDGSRADGANWHARWDNFIKDFDKVDLIKSKEFKYLLRSGVPQEYRCKVWKSLVNMQVLKERNKLGSDYYQELLDHNGDIHRHNNQNNTSRVDERNVDQNKPSNISTTTNTSETSSPSSTSSSYNPSTKQIELDLLRTLPNNKHFETLESPGTTRLRRVLSAYSQHNPKVGYCQGMNRLAAVALLVLPEEESFWCLSAIVDHMMPDGYYNDLWLAQADSNVVMDLVSIKMPYLNEHFRKHSIELSLFAWFLTIYVDGTPPAFFLRLWDSFLFEGDKILFRVSLALLKMHEDELLRLTNSVAINNYLRACINTPMDLDRFFEIAFDWINPLSTRSLRAKRQSQLEKLRARNDKILNPTTSVAQEAVERKRSVVRKDEHSSGVMNV